MGPDTCFLLQIWVPLKWVEEIFLQVLHIWGLMMDHPKISLLDLLHRGIRWDLHKGSDHLGPHPPTWASR
jgi:hypothetical protein